MNAKHVFICVLLLVASLDAIALPQSPQWQIPSTAMGVAIVRPKDALAQPGMQVIPYEVITVAGKRELGFDPCQIVKATGIVEAPESLEGPPPGFALVLEFDAPQEPGEKILANLEKGTFQGMTIYRNSSQDQPALLQLNDRTLIVGLETFIGQMLAGKTEDSALSKLITAQPSSGHFAAWVTIEPVRELIHENLPPADQIPFPFQNFIRFPDLIDNITVTADLSANGEQKLQIGAIDEKSAKEIWKTTKFGLSIARGMVMGQLMSEMSDSDNEMNQAMQQYFDRVADLVEAGLEPDFVGANLIFQNKEGNQMTNIATIGVLTGLLLPAVQQVREAARRTQSMNNMKQLILAMHNHESAYKKLPAQSIISKGGQPLLSWRVQMLPYLEEQALYDQFHQDEPWDSPHNIKLLDKMPAIFRNPSLPASHDTVYLLFAGPNTAFVDGKAPQFRDFRDGLSNTLAIVEADPDYAVPWTRPMDIEFDPDQPRAGIQGSRPGGFIAAMFDGSVEFITENIDDETIRNLVNPNDGNVIQNRQ